MHFGASQRQISIHTGVAYLKENRIAFSTFSDCLKHSPSGIWAHLEPVLKHIQTQSNNQLESVHFVSDGPTTQYRSKSNFYLLSAVIHEFGFSHATWNFMESGHGKGAPDGIGAAVKRQADDLVVCQQKDIMKANDLIQGLKNTSTIKLFEVKEESVQKYEERLCVPLNNVPETMKVHQVAIKGSHSVASRVLSCFCSGGCNCYNPVETCLLKQTALNDISNRSLPAAEEGVVTDATLLTNDQNSLLQKVTVVDESLMGRHCVVEYDSSPYPGIILDVDEDDVEVRVMNRIGINRFFWPLLEDRLWYNKTKVVTMLDEEPQKVTNRHCQITPSVWQAIVIEMDLD